MYNSLAHSKYKSTESTIFCNEQPFLLKNVESAKKVPKKKRAHKLAPTSVEMLTKLYASKTDLQSCLTSANSK